MRSRRPPTCSRTPASRGRRGSPSRTRCRRPRSRPRNGVRFARPATQASIISMQPSNNAAGVLVGREVHEVDAGAWVAAVESVCGADVQLPPADLGRVGQEHVRSGEVDRQEVAHRSTLRDRVGVRSRCASPGDRSGRGGIRAMTSIDELLVEARAFLDAHRRRRPDPTRSSSGVRAPTGSTSSRRPTRPRSCRRSWRTPSATPRCASMPGSAGSTGRSSTAAGGSRSSTRRPTQELEADYELPDLSMLTIAIGFIGPALLAHATPELRAAYLPKLYRGDLVMCQLFSEPNAGSDLAAARTRAERDGDEWVVNGQKVWTSSAHVADLALAVCRTDPDVPKHQGLTHLPRRHARARRRGASAPPDDGQRQLQRGVPHRRARPRLAPGRRAATRGSASS